MITMGTRRNLTVGVTVNLEHYENLRLEVSGEVETERDADDLVRFLDHLLGRMGRGDPATAGAVDSYRSRVFSFTPDLPEEQVPARCHDYVCSLPADILKEIPTGSVGTAEAANAGGEGPSARMVPEPGNNAPDIAGTVPAPVPPAAADTTGVLVCDECGTPVTAAQGKMSRLFTSRTLCKECMKKP
jgi:hypothetical protein